MGWLSAILGLAGMLGGGGQGNSNVPANGDQQKLINETLGVQMKRMNQQNPLYEAVQKLAMRLMPTAVQAPITPWDQVSPYGNYMHTKDDPAGPVPDPIPPKVPGDTPSSPGRGNPQPRKPDRGVTSGIDGIDPGVLATLFGAR